MTTTATRGQIVQYQLPAVPPAWQSPGTRAAIVVAVNTGGSVDLQLFYDGINDSGTQEQLGNYAMNVAHGTTAGTWS